MPAPVIKNATTIWDINVNWPLSSQCGTWDPKGRGVDVWECIQARTCSSSPLPTCAHILHRIRRLFNAGYIGMPLPSILLYISLFFHTSLQTPCTGATSDADDASASASRPWLPPNVALHIYHAANPSHPRC
ncbi:hypothetical protein JVU11DRAFT_5941 [Chiua virens]|nr:hypothetical protein JVU11DRAFT_5941 [Chiua virens]